MISIILFYCCSKVFNSYEYMDDWKKYNEESLPEKEYFYSHLNIDRRHYWRRLHYTEKVCKDFEIKNSGGYHDFYVQSDTLLLADAFENFQNMCLEIYSLDSSHFI